MSTDALAMVTDDAALADHVVARRAALQDELDRIRAQKAALEAKLAELRPAAPPKKGGGVGVPAGSAGKKRPGGAGAGRPGEPPYDPSIPLTGPAKRARVEADRERRVNLLWQQCATIAKTLMRHRDSAPFHKPVDPVALKCPDYLTIIKTPMDLGTALARLGGTPGGPPRAYSAPTEFRDNVRLMFANCRTYNKVGTPVRRMGDALSDLWEKKWAQQGIEAKWALEMERQKDEQLELDGAPEHVIKMRQMDRELRALQEVAAAAGGPAPPRPTHPGERDMSFEEKRRLSTALGSLPADKLGKALDIVAVAHPLPEGVDEVELDIDALGRETLWKLDAYCLSVMPQIHVAKDKPSAAATAAANAAGAWAASGRAGAPPAGGAAAGGPPAKPAPAPLPATTGGTKAGSDSGSQGEVGSKQGSGASGELKKPSAGGPGGAAAPDMSALVSATRPGGPGGPPGPAIIKHMAHKKEVTLQNAGAWAGLAADAAGGGGPGGGGPGGDGPGGEGGPGPAGAAPAPAGAEGAPAPASGDGPTGPPPAGPGGPAGAPGAAPGAGGGGGGGDNLWAEFQSREEAQHAREAAKAAEDARLKAEQAAKEAAAAAELEAKRRAAEEEAAAAAAAKEAEAAAARAAAEEARRAELDAMRNVARPDEEAGGDAGAAALLQAAGGAAAGFGLVHADDESDDSEDEEMEDGEA